MNFLFKFNLILVTSLLFLIGFFFSLSVGATNIFAMGSGQDVWACFVQTSHEPLCDILSLRLSRTLTAAYVGGALALAGAVLQSVLANPIADPFVLGISAGGTTGAVLTTLLLPSLVFFDVVGPSAAAFLGCLFTFFLLYLAQRALEKRMQTNMLPVVGLILNSFFGAIVLIVLSIFANNHGEVYRWYVGNIFDVGFKQIQFIYVLGFFSALVLTHFAPLIKMLAFGDDFFLNTGYSPRKTRLIALLCVTFLIATTVSVSGAVGFVGLIVPHIVKTFSHTPIRLQWVANLLLGAAFVCVSDGLARSIASPTEIPVGLFTACFGVPALAFIFLKRAELREQRL